MAKKPSYPREEALQPIRRKPGLTSNGSEALGDKDRERSPRRDRERSPKRQGSIRDRLGPPQPELRQQYSPQQFTPLTATVSKALREVQHEKFLRWTSQMRSDPTKRDNTRYCEFHRDHGHRTDDCIQLRKEI